MKKCNTEIMKEIKKLESDKASWVCHERNNCTVSYMSNEDPLIPEYDYKDTTESLKWFDDEIRRLKGLLAYSNATTIVDGFNMTINEALVYLAQLNEREKRLNYLISFKPISRKTIGIDGKIEFTKILFDQEDALKRHTATKNEIMQLQMAIDRTNLTNFIEV